MPDKAKIKRHRVDEDLAEVIAGAARLMHEPETKLTNWLIRFAIAPETLHGDVRERVEEAVAWMRHKASMKETAREGAVR